VVLDVLDDPEDQAEVSSSAAAVESLRLHIGEVP